MKIILIISFLTFYKELNLLILYPKTNNKFMKKFKFEIPVKTQTGGTTVIRADKIKGFSELIPSEKLSDHLYAQSQLVKEGLEFQPLKVPINIDKFNHLVNLICKKVKPSGITMEIPVYSSGLNIFTFLKSIQ